MAPKKAALKKKPGLKALDTKAGDMDAEAEALLSEAMLSFRGPATAQPPAPEKPALGLPARVGDGDDSPFVRFKPPPLLRQISEKHSHKTTIELLKEKSDGDDSEEAAEEEPKEEEVRRKEAEPPVGSDVAPPRLVRGKTGLMKKRNHEYDAIAALVAEALPSWAGIDAEEIEVSEVSGHGGSKTFKVAAPPDGGFEPPVVALHSRSEAVTSEDVSEKRLEAASAALTAVGATPRRLAQGGDWYIVAWAGKALGGPFSSCDAKPDELGKLMVAHLCRQFDRKRASTIVVGSSSDQRGRHPNVTSRARQLQRRHALELDGWICPCFE